MGTCDTDARVDFVQSASLLTFDLSPDGWNIDTTSAVLAIGAERLLPDDPRKRWVIDSAHATVTVTLPPRRVGTLDSCVVHLDTLRALDRENRLLKPLAVTCVYRWTGVEEHSVVAHRGPLSLTVSPNPARDAILLSVDAPSAGPARLDLFDLTGQRVASPWKGWIASGRTAITAIIPASLRSGLYYARLTVGTTTTSERIVILR